MKSNLIGIVIFMAFALGCGTIYHFVEVGKYEDTIRSLRTQIDDLRMRLTFKQQELSACRRDSTDLEETLRTTREELKDKKEDLEKAESRLEKMSATKVKLERRIEDLEAEVAELTAQLTAKQAQLDSLLALPHQAAEEGQKNGARPVSRPVSLSIGLPKSEKVFLFVILLIIGFVGALSIAANKNKRLRYR